MRNKNFKTVYRRLHTTDDIRVPCTEFVVPRTAQTSGRSSKHGQLIPLALAVMIFAFSISSVFASGTISYFNDVESSLNNLFRAGTLDFTVALSDPNSSHIKLTAGAASVTVIPTVVPGVGDFPLAYRVTVQKMGGTSEALCNAIDVSASSPPFSYNGKLIAFSEGTTTIISPLSLSLSLPADSNFTLADNCMIDVVYSGWVDGQNEGMEYHDMERVSLFISDPPAATSTDDTNVPSGTTPVIQDVTPDATTTVSTDSTSTPTVDSTSTPATDEGGNPPSGDLGTAPPLNPPIPDTATTTDTTAPPPADTSTTTPPTDTTLPPPVDTGTSYTSSPPPADNSTVDTPPALDTPTPNVTPSPADTTAADAPSSPDTSISDATPPADTPPPTAE